MSLAFHTPAELQLALSALVPAMGFGLTIQTGGHSITLPPGRLADRLSDELAQGLRLEVMRREAARQMHREATDKKGLTEADFRKDAVLIGAAKERALP